MHSDIPDGRVTRESKTIFVVIPPFDKDDPVQTLKLKLTSEEELDRLTDAHRGMLTAGDEAFMYFKDLLDNQVYTFMGGLYHANMDSRSRRRRDCKMMQVGCALAVLRAVRTPEQARLHLYQEDQDDSTRTDAVKFESIVIDKKDGPNATAYVVKSGPTPQPESVDRLLEMVEEVRLSAQAKKSAFHHCTAFVPVLGGEVWSDETIARCQAHSPPIWRVQPTVAPPFGAKAKQSVPTYQYQLHRTFSYSSSSTSTAFRSGFPSRALKMAILLFK
jgi:hypothetical protein